MGGLALDDDTGRAHLQGVGGSLLGGKDIGENGHPVVEVAPGTDNLTIDRHHTVASLHAELISGTTCGDTINDRGNEGDAEHRTVLDHLQHIEIAWQRKTHRLAVTDDIDTVGLGYRRKKSPLTLSISLNSPSSVPKSTSPSRKPKALASSLKTIPIFMSPTL